MGFPEQEIVVTATVKEADDGRIVTDTVAEQSGNQIIRNASAPRNRASAPVSQLPRGQARGRIGSAGRARRS